MKRDTIKVVHILPWLSKGGVEQRRYLLAKGLGEEFEQVLVYMQDNEGWVGRFREEGVKVIRVRGGRGWSPFDVEAIRQIRGVLAEEVPDLVHGGVFEGVSMATLSGAFMGKSSVIIEETGDPDVRGSGGDLLMAIYSRIADACVGISEPVSDYFRHRLRVDPSKVVCVENGIRAMGPITDDEQLRLRHQWGIGEDDLVIGTVGRFHEYCKRFKALIRLVARLRPDYPGIKLLLVGDGQDRDILEEEVARLDLSQEVIFTGFRQDVEKFYGVMDVFSLLSVQEGFGLVVAEAMACELPTVVTAVGGMKTVSVPGETGFQVDGNKPMEAEGYLRRLLNDPSMRQRMGRAGRKRAMEKYSEEAYVNRVRDLYRRVCESEVQNVRESV